MKNIFNFTFSLGVSVESYSDKKEALASMSRRSARAIGKKKMGWIEQTVTPSQFLNLATKGHTFCALYRLDPSKKYISKYRSPKSGRTFWTKSSPFYSRTTSEFTAGALKSSFKTLDLVTGCQAIFVDIDKTEYQSIPEFIGALRDKPTVAYPSYSDNQSKGGVISRRFHLVYVFDYILSPTEFTEKSGEISRMIEECTGEKILDSCGEVIAQYFNGVTGTSETYSYPVVYEATDFCASSSPSLSTPHPSSLDIPKELIFSDSSTSWESFIGKYWGWNKYYQNSTESWDMGEEIKEVDEDYFTLPYYSTPREDLQKRRKTVYTRMCLRRIMNPSLTPSQILYCAHRDVLSGQFDNSDDVFTGDFYERNISNCFSYSVQELVEIYSDTLDTLTSTRGSKEGIIFNPSLRLSIGERQERIKEVREKKISENLDPQKSLQENLKELQKIMKISERSLYGYYAEKGLKVKWSDPEIKSILDKNLSIRQNLEVLKKEGIKCSKDRVSKLLKTL